MSGTSVDAIDAVLIAVSHVDSNVKVQVIDATQRVIPDALKIEIQLLMTPGENEIARAGNVHNALAVQYIQAAKQLINDYPQHAVDVIGSHGQTVRHQPDGESRFTLQLGCGATMATHTGIPVVTDFRSADMACGGQGAPFAPFLHQALFRSESEHRAIINLGGIANITHLPVVGNGAVTGFDTGPANTLLDLWYRRHNKGGFDPNGDWAVTGEVVDALLSELMNDAYFLRLPPKSTGREYFNLDWLDQKLDGKQHKPEDVQATLVALTTQSIRKQIEQLQPDVQALYVCGGGVLNGHLMESLQTACGIPVNSTLSLGMDPQHVEAATFAWLGLQTLQRTPSTIPSVTGASKSTVAGAVYFP